MNATGVQLNPQELRNAEYYGEFKTVMYEIAAEQLQRWRDWHIFSENDIARMQEVELVSEFALMVTKGVTGKSQKSINDIYKKYDATYAQKTVFEQRFRRVMDAIDAALGKDMAQLPFRKRTIFYSLFAFVFGRHFGLTRGLVKKKAITSTTIGWLKEAGYRLDAGNAPRDVLDAAARRTTHPSSRTRMVRYLADG
jgi:hypothetical protein